MSRNRVHLQEVYRALGYQRGDLPESELAQEQVLSLPMYPELGEEQIHEVVERIKEFIKNNRKPFTTPGVQISTV